MKHDIHNPLERQKEVRELNEIREIGENIGFIIWKYNPNGPNEKSIFGTLKKKPFEDWTIGINPLVGEDFNFEYYVKPKDDTDLAHQMGGKLKGSQTDAEKVLFEWLRDQKKSM